MNNYRYRRPCQMNNNNCCNMTDDDNHEEEVLAQSETCCHVPEVPKCDCDCGFDNEDNSMFPSNPMFGQSYVPIQRMKKVFKPEVGLKMGTIFPELVSPYTPCQSIREIEYIRNANEIGEGCNR